MKYLIHAVFSLMTLAVSAQSPIGVWKTIDDDSGKARSYVEIYEQDGMLFGKVTQLLDENPNVLCDRCSGDKENTPVVGLVILEKLKPHKDYWHKGKILDPENGKEYTCELWMEGGNLKVKGKHWTGLYRTQTWYPL